MKLMHESRDLMIVANVVPRPPRSSYNLLNLRETVLVSATYVGESVKGRAVEQPARERGRKAVSRLHGLTVTESARLKP